MKNFHSDTFTMDKVPELCEHVEERDIAAEKTDTPGEKCNSSSTTTIFHIYIYIYIYISKLVIECWRKVVKWQIFVRKSWFQKWNSSIFNNTAGCLKNSARYSTDNRNIMLFNEYFFAACVGCQWMLTLFLARRFLSPWWWRRYVPPKRRSYNSHMT
jgi:hypothetical protein